jgi:hypothetical protein
MDHGAKQQQKTTGNNRRNSLPAENHRSGKEAEMKGIGESLEARSEFH